MDSNEVKRDPSDPGPGLAAGVAAISVTVEAGIRGFRSKLDWYLNSFHLIRSSREVSLAYTALQLAYSSLGKALGSLNGSNTPYTESDEPQSEKIHMRQDHDPSNDMEEYFKTIPQTHTARIKGMRYMIQEQYDQFDDFMSKTQNRHDEFLIWATQFIIHLCNAKIWFGWELDRIQKERAGSSVKYTLPIIPL